MATRCTHCGKQFDKPSIRKCPYSVKGSAVCFWCCKNNCHYAEWVGIGMIRCTYQRKKERQEEQL